MAPVSVALCVINSPARNASRVFLPPRDGESCGIFPDLPQIPRNKWVVQDCSGQKHGALNPMQRCQLRIEGKQQQWWTVLPTATELDTWAASCTAQLSANAVHHDVQLCAEILVIHHDAPIPRPFCNASRSFL